MNQKYTRYEHEGVLTYTPYREGAEFPKNQRSAYQTFWGVIAILSIGSIASIALAFGGGEGYPDFEYREAQRLNALHQQIAPYAQDYCTERIADISQKIKMNTALEQDNSALESKQKELSSNCMKQALDSLSFL